MHIFLKLLALPLVALMCLGSPIAQGAPSLTADIATATPDTTPTPASTPTPPTTTTPTSTPTTSTSTTTTTSETSTPTATATPTPKCGMKLTYILCMQACALATNKLDCQDNCAKTSC